MRNILPVLLLHEAFTWTRHIVFKCRLNIDYGHYKYETILSVTSLMSCL